MAGARTLDGALIPLKGSGPTNFNFVTGDYNRKTGLKGNGTTKYLDTNRNNNADPQNSKHLAVFVNTFHTQNATSRIDLGTTPISSGSSHLRTSFNVVKRRATRINYASGTLYNEDSSNPGFWAASRNSSSNHQERFDQITRNFSFASAAPISENIRAFAFSDARLMFYSIGESADLEIFDSRVSTLMSDLAAAI